MAIDPSNLSSTPAGYQTPEQIQQQNELARLLGKNATEQSQITNFWQGPQKLMDAATAAYVRNKTGQQQQHGYDVFNRNLTSVPPPLTPYQQYPAVPGNPTGTPVGAASNSNPMMAALFSDPYSVG